MYVKDTIRDNKRHQNQNNVQFHLPSLIVYHQAQNLFTLLATALEPCAFFLSICNRHPQVGKFLIHWAYLIFTGIRQEDKHLIQGLKTTKFY